MYIKKHYRDFHHFKVSMSKGKTVINTSFHQYFNNIFFHKARAAAVDATYTQLLHINAPSITV